MIQSRRRRFGMYAVDQKSTHGRVRAAMFLVAVLVVVFCVWGMIRLFASGGERLRAATELFTEGRGRVEVVISGEGLFSSNRLFSSSEARERRVEKREVAIKSPPRHDPFDRNFPLRLFRYLAK